MKYQVKVEKIQNFLEEITEEQVRDVQELTSSNIPTITVQILDHRRATESEGMCTCIPKNSFEMSALSDM